MRQPVDIIIRRIENFGFFSWKCFIVLHFRTRWTNVLVCIPRIVHMCKRRECVAFFNADRGTFTLVRLLLRVCLWCERRRSILALIVITTGKNSHPTHHLSPVVCLHTRAMPLEPRWAVAATMSRVRQMHA